MTKELTALAPYTIKISEIPDRNNMIADAKKFPWRRCDAPAIYIYIFIYLTGVKEPADFKTLRSRTT